MPRVHRANFWSINDTRIIGLLGSLSNPKFALSLLQSIANFGFGTLGLTITGGLVRAHGQVAPARHPLQADRDDEPFGDLHRRHLVVPRA